MERFLSIILENFVWLAISQKNMFSRRTVSVYVNSQSWNYLVMVAEVRKSREIQDRIDKTGFIRIVISKYVKISITYKKCYE